MSGIPIVALLAADAPGILSLFGPAQWGIFSQTGQPVLVSESVGSIEYHREYDVANYPQELPQAFQSYNKVQIPFEAKVTLLSNLTRFELLAILEPAVASLQLVTVVMPEFAYPSANLIRYAFRRAERSGVTLIAVDVWCREIRTVASSPAPGQASPSVAQQQAVGGTDRPIGTVNGGSNLAPGPGSSSPPGPSSAIDTGSTNAASPTQSGPVQPVEPGGGGSSSLTLAPESDQFVVPE